MSDKYIRLLVIALALSIPLFGCSGGGRGSSSITTPMGTSVNLGVIKSFAEASGAPGTTITFNLSGTVSNGHISNDLIGTASYSISQPTSTVISSVTTTVNVLLSMTSVTNTASNEISSDTFASYMLTTGFLFKEVDSSTGLIGTPTGTQTLLPANAKVGDVGSYMTISFSDGTTETQTWRIDPGNNGDAILVMVTTTTDTLSNMMNIESDSYTIKQDGTISALSININDLSSGTTINLAGAAGPVTQSQYNLNVTALSFSTMQLTWSSISGAAGYRILRTDLGYLSSVTGGILTYTDTGFFPTAQYYCYYVQAYDVWGNGLAMSNQACASTEWIVLVRQYASLRVDDYGDLFVAYYDQTYKIIKYATAGVNYPAQWNIKLDPYSDVFSGITDISLAIDPHNLYPQYVLVGSNQPFGGGVVALSNITSGGFTNLAYTSSGGDAKLAMDGAKNLHVAYCDAFPKRLVYMTNWWSGNWNSFIVDSGSVGNFTSIAVDSSDKAQISYYDAANGYLKIAVQMIPGSYNAWNTYVIDSAGNVGLFTSIAIDSVGKTHISYYDAGNGWLKYATNRSGAWNTYVIDNSANVGMYSSIAVDSNGNAHMSYYDATNKALKYATNSSGKWVAIMVDSSADVGQRSSIVVDSQGKVHISYYDQTNRHQKYASNYFGQWNTYIIDGL